MTKRVTYPWKIVQISVALNMMTEYKYRSKPAMERARDDLREKMKGKTIPVTWIHIYEWEEDYNRWALWARIDLEGEER